MFLSLPPIVQDILRLSIWLVILMSIFPILEWLFAERHKAIFRRNFLTDLAYYFINGLLPKVILAPLLALLALGLQHLTPFFVQTWVNHMSTGWRVITMLFVGELGFYWGHRWMHEVPFLWRFHAIHHSAEQMDWLVNTRAHPVDIIIPRLCGFTLLALCGLVRPMAQSTDMASFLFIFIGVAWGFFIHANLRWRFGWLEQVIATPAFHHWHHANDTPETMDKNYSSMLPCFDRLFGTLYLPKEQPIKYGTDSVVSDNLVAQLLLKAAKKSSVKVSVCNPIHEKL